MQIDQTGFAERTVPREHSDGSAHLYKTEYTHSRGGVKKKGTVIPNDRVATLREHPTSSQQYTTGLLNPWQLPYVLARCAVDGDGGGQKDRVPRLRSAYTVQELHEFWTPLRDAVEAIHAQWVADGGRPCGPQREKAPLPIPPVPLCQEIPQHFGDIAVATAPHPCALWVRRTAAVQGWGGGLFGTRK